jgi:hypothetical protein
MLSLCFAPAQSQGNAGRTHRIEYTSLDLVLYTSYVLNGLRRRRREPRTASTCAQSSIEQPGDYSNHTISQIITWEM